MRIGFLLGWPGISGGSYVIYEHASRLKRKGHSVAVITRQEVWPEDHAWHSSAAELDWLTLRQARTECFDVVFATWWETAFLLRKLKTKHCAYFVQSIESRFFEPPDPQHPRNVERTLWRSICEQTYSCAVPMITEARWIQDYLHRHHNNWPYLVRNGIRKDIYTADGPAVAPRQPGRFRVLVEGPTEVFFKNVPAAVRLAKAAGADEIWLLTSSAIQSWPDVDGVFSRVPIHETPAVYRSCDLLLKLSHVEGMFGPPLEMFHCGGTALVYDVTGHDEYIVHNQNSYVAAKDDEEAVVRLLRGLKENPAELERLKRGAAETAAAWPDWDACAAQFEQALLEIAAGKPVSRTYLQTWTRELFRSRKPFVHARLQEQFAAREKADWEGKRTQQNNFILFYWSGDGTFSDQQSEWRHFQNGEWTECLFNLRVEELPLWLRLDPASRIGITEIDCIIVRNISQGREIMVFREQEEFQRLFLAKDLKWLCPERKNSVFTYGPEPIILLPKVKKGEAELGDLLELSIRLRENGMQQLNNLASTADDEGGNNAIVLYWDGEGQFNGGKSLLRHYIGEEWATVSFTLSVEEVPLWLRLDPSRRVGFIELASLVVRNATRQEEIMTFRQPDDFQQLFLTGSLTRLAPKRINILFSGGANAICVLPKIEQEQISIGDMLEITVTLRESSPQQFAARHHVSIAARPLWKKLLLRGARRLGLAKT
ncbi:MAG: glycosyltransferase family 4 protein [Candidatus Electronema sp. V4]|uniref:glycosyltransferase family 4 protein n=1 Tax=Candidatus Electronema sp. V4 TaxID=3454756 RepID=UPI004055949A